MILLFRCAPLCARAGLSDPLPLHIIAALQVPLTADEICREPSLLTLFSQWADMLTLTNASVHAAHDHMLPSLYIVGAINCGYSAVTLNMTYDFMNPGGEELSTTEIPFKKATLVMGAGWAVVIILWFGNIIRNKSVRVWMRLPCVIVRPALLHKFTRISARWCSWRTPCIAPWGLCQR